MSTKNLALFMAMLNLGFRFSCSKESVLLGSPVGISSGALTSRAVWHLGNVACGHEHQVTSALQDH